MKLEIKENIQLIVGIIIFVIGLNLEGYTSLIIGLLGGMMITFSKDW